MKLVKESSRKASRINLMYRLKKIALEIHFKAFIPHEDQERHAHKSKRIKGMAKRKPIASENIFRLLIILVESRSKSAKLSLKAKLSFSIPSPL